MPSEQELKAYYDREQWFEGGETGGYQDYERQTIWSVDALHRILQGDYAGRTNLSILDVGCGYGAHLEAAAALGWKCFGTEISDHARRIAQKRLGGRAYITERVEELIPHEFDVVLILDVIEHLADPYSLFFSLFSIGAITPKTRLIITTPNAGSNEALRNPADWTYRHPPSHLVYYCKETFEFLLSKIGFDTVRVRGEHLLSDVSAGDQTLADYAGLHVEAEGSNFTEFMRERYVPGTWSKIAEYEHLPRYALAKRFVQGKAVLDFGCGTGYGAAVLAESAARVKGLDIDAGAIAWATATHHGSGVEYYRCDDLGASLPEASFDVVTCFEMIEHVDFETQHRTIQQVARLLREDGLFVISTPNPEITGLYGANPYHLREMTREEFEDLLRPHFPYLHIVEQRVRDSVSFESTRAAPPASIDVLQEPADRRLIPLAYIAFCSKLALPNIAPAVMFDDSRDVIQDFLLDEKKKNTLRFSAYGLAEQVERQSAELEHAAQEIKTLLEPSVTTAPSAGEGASWAEELSRKDEHLSLLGQEVSRLEALIQTKDHRLQEIGRDIQRLNDSLADKQRLLVDHAQLIGRQAELEARYARKDTELADLGEEVHRLEAMVQAKDQRLHEIGQQFEETLALLVLRDPGPQRRAADVARTEAIVQARDQRLRQIGHQLEDLKELLAHRELDLRKQAADIERLESELVESRDRMRVRGAELNTGLDALLAARDEAAVDHARNLQQAETLLAELVHQTAKLRAGAAVLVAASTRSQTLEQDLAALARRSDDERHYFYGEVEKRDQLLADAHAQHDQLKAELQTTAVALRTLKLTRWFRLRELLLFHPFGLRKLILVGVTVAGGLVPRRLRPTLVPRLQRLLGLAPAAVAKSSGSSSAYHVKVPEAPAVDAPRIVHAIANFMTGGSSRLVIDLIEHLGGDYRQFVLTSFNPDPPAYLGVQIDECRFPNGVSPLIEYFERTRPDLVHVHYWGDCDEPWYAKVIDAARRLGLPVIENVNTPIQPHRSEAVSRYVYVSDYVRSVFGESDARHVTVYPGSDFGLFTRTSCEQVPGDCVGMVYRLERDKLNEDAIQPFIHIARLRPSTRILIVGGGSLQELFQIAVKAAGVADRFEFTGYVPYDTLPSYYRRMTLFVAPVWKESFGQVSPFAMSMKVPVIGYDVGAISEIVGNRELLAPPGEAERLARIAVQLLNDPDEIRRLGEEQQRRAEENFSLQAMINHYARIYTEVFSEAKVSA